MVNNEKTALFEQMPVKKAIAVMAVPTIISQLINLVYNIVDTYFIGRTGNSYMIAAVSVAYTLYMMTVAFGNLFGIGGGSLMARLFGRGEYERARNVSAYSFYGAIVIAAIYSVAISICCNPLLRLLGASDQTIGYARQYVYLVVVAGDIPIVLSAVMSHLIRNAGYSRQASLGLSLGGVLNIILDPIFMFRVLPSGYEVFGAALATLISNIVACVYLFIIYCKLSSQTALCLKLSQAIRIHSGDRMELYSVGVPSAVLTGLFDVANMFLNAKMALYGESAVAALGIVMKAERLPNAVNIGICQGMMPIIAYNYSSGNRNRMKEVIRTATVYGLIIAVVSTGLFQILAKPITGIFINSQSDAAVGAAETLAFATFFLRIRCLASPLQFMNYRCSFCMQAMGDGKGTLLHAIVRELVFYIPFMYVLDYRFGVDGLIASLIAGEACGMVMALILLKKQMKKTA